MAIHALNLHDQQTITHPHDTDGDPTQWVIGAVDSRVYGILSDKSLVVGVDTENMDGEADVKMNRNALAYEVVQFGLRGFTNFKDEQGDVEFKTERKTVGSKAYDVVRADILARIPGYVLQWLHDEIIALNKLDIEEGK